MPTNSLSEILWDVLHETQALITSGGFVSAYPELATLHSQGTVEESTVLPFSELLSRYNDRLALGADWPAGFGSQSPLGLILTDQVLQPREIEFVKTWFENPRVNLSLRDHFWVQPLPPFVGEEASYADFFKEVCLSFKPKAILSLGAVPAQKLLAAPLSLSTLRSTDYRFGSFSIITTLDPVEYFQIAADNMTDQTAFKGQVWKDLQRLLGKLRYTP